MARQKKTVSSAATPLLKCLTGIQGLDEITHGGLPRYRCTLVTGSSGCGKTLVGIQFLINGAKKGERGLFVSFEESEDELIENCSSLKFNLKSAMNKHHVILRHIPINRNEFDESGEYNLDGLFVRLGLLIDKYKIKRVVLDTIEVLFGHLANDAIIRSELQRLFRWMKTKKVTAIVTAEEGKETITRYGLEEYVSDCVIVLDNLSFRGLATRHLRVIKYRGSEHGSNKYPFIIDQQGISVLPITSINMDFLVPRTFISSGIKRLDEMLNGNGYYKGGSILITGTAGVGKTSFAVAFANSICKKGKKCIYFAFEEASDQIIRNAGTIGIRLDRWVNRKKLLFQAIKPTVYGLESHLLKMMQLIEEYKPDAVIIDPITNFKLISSPLNVKLMLVRLLSYLKSKQITTVMTSLLREGTVRGEENASSLMDTWILLKHIEFEGERSIVASIQKSRGMPHSKQIREVIISNKGVDLEDVYIGTGKLLTGSARVIQAMQDNIKSLQKDYEYREKLGKISENKKQLTAEIENLKQKIESLETEGKIIASEKSAVENLTQKELRAVSQIRLPKSVKLPK